MQDLTITTPDTLQTLVTNSVVAAVQLALPPLLRQANLPPYLTKKQLMELTGWSSRTVEYKKSQGKIPYIRRDRLCLFPTDEILAYFEEGRVPAKEVSL